MKTLVFRSHNPHALSQLTQALQALSIDRPRQFGDGGEVYEVRMHVSNQEVVEAMLRNRGFEVVGLSEADIQAARIAHVADKLDLLVAALNGSYKSEDD